MLLAIDVGNTNTVLGVFDGHRLLQHWRLETSTRRTGDEYGALALQLFAHGGLDPRHIEAVLVASVVPALDASLRTMASRYFGCEAAFVDAARAGMPVRCENPAEIGADRIVNAVAGFEKHRCALILVDLGTATTLDVVSADGAFLGGVICPGLHSCADALARAASKLPRVELKRPEKVIGRTTVASMQSGLLLGYVAMVDGLCARIAAELGGEPKIVATGGLARLVAGESQQIVEIDDLLTLEGLRIIHERLH